MLLHLLCKGILNIEGQLVAAKLVGQVGDDVCHHGYGGRRRLPVVEEAGASRCCSLIMEQVYVGMEIARLDGEFLARFAQNNRRHLADIKPAVGGHLGEQVAVLAGMYRESLAPKRRVFYEQNRGNEQF